LSPGITAFLRQPSDETVPAGASWSSLVSLVGGGR
jgi:hypothetical protein